MLSCGTLLAIVLFRSSASRSCCRFSSSADFCGGGCTQHNKPLHEIGSHGTHRSRPLESTVENIDRGQTGHSLDYESHKRINTCVWRMFRTSYLCIRFTSNGLQYLHCNWLRVHSFFNRQQIQAEVNNSAKNKFYSGECGCCHSGPPARNGLSSDLRAITDIGLSHIGIELN